jgi:hypothetical protein
VAGRIAAEQQERADLSQLHGTEAEAVNRGALGETLV